MLLGMEWNEFAGNGLVEVFWLVWEVFINCMFILVILTNGRWITKREYEEYGKNWEQGLLQKRCP